MTGKCITIFQIYVLINTLFKNLGSGGLYHNLQSYKITLRGQNYNLKKWNLEKREIIPTFALPNRKGAMGSYD